MSQDRRQPILAKRRYASNIDGGINTSSMNVQAVLICSRESWPSQPVDRRSGAGSLPRQTGQPVRGALQNCRPSCRSWRHARWQRRNRYRRGLGVLGGSKGGLGVVTGGDLVGSDYRAAGAACLMGHLSAWFSATIPTDAGPMRLSGPLQQDNVLVATFVIYLRGCTFDRVRSRPAPARKRLGTRYAVRHAAGFGGRVSDPGSLPGRSSGAA